MARRLRAGRRLLQFRQQRVGRGNDVSPLGRLALGHRLGDLQLAAFRVRLRLRRSPVGSYIAQPAGGSTATVSVPRRD